MSETTIEQILDKLLEDIVDANFNGYNYELNNEATKAITDYIMELIDTTLENQLAQRSDLFAKEAVKTFAGELRDKLKGKINGND